jgi:hypothetical protein
MSEQPADRIEKTVNRRHTQAIELMRRIIDDLPYEGFTEDDVRESYNPLAHGAGVAHGDNTVIVRYGTKHLQYLVAKGLLSYADNRYQINWDHHWVARELVSADDGFGDEDGPEVDYD